MKDEAVLPGPVDVVELVLDVLVNHHQLEHVPLHLEHNILGGNEDYLVNCGSGYICENVTTSSSRTRFSKLIPPFSSLPFTSLLAWLPF